jgi:hypothetical protein
MRGTSLCSLLLAAVSLLAAAPAGRRHEVQFRRNDYLSVPEPARLRAAGLAKAILRLFSDDEAGGGLYFRSGFFPVMRPVLDRWADSYAGGGVPLWGWLGARKFAWLADRTLLDGEWRDGGVRSIPKLDLFNPQAQELIVRLFGELARQRVDGILIQDDLTLLQSEGFTAWGLAGFRQACALDADPRLMLARGTAQHRAWQELKVAKVRETLGRIVASCKQANSAVEIGLNVHYEAPLTPGRARSWYAFDISAANASAVDRFYLMAYWRQIKAELKLDEGENRLYFRRMLEAALALWGPRLVVKVQVRDWQSGAPIHLDELLAYYGLIPAAVERVCFAAADPEDLDLISKVITR